MGEGDDEPTEIGDARQKHVTVVSASGERIEHGDVYLRHSATGFAVSSDPDFPEGETTRYEKDDLARVEITQHHSACFIATATADEAALDALRGFRDDALAPSTVGRGLLAVYEAVSPPVARTLARHPGSRTARIVRWLVHRCAALARRRRRRRGVRRTAASVALVAGYVVGLLLAAAGHLAIRLTERVTAGRTGGRSRGG